jgi:hypothetical protein
MVVSRPCGQRQTTQSHDPADHARVARTRVRTTSVGVGSPTAVGVCGYLTVMVRPRRTQEVT